MGNELGPVTQLFSSLGLDASELDKGLRDAAIRMEAFEKPVFAVQQMLDQLFSSMNPAIVVNALNQLAVAAKTPAEAIAFLHAEVKSLNAEMAAPRQMVSLDNNDVVDAAMARAEMQRARIEERSLQAQSNAAVAEDVAKRAEARSAEIAIEREYANLKKQFAAEVVAADAREEAAQDAFVKQEIADSNARLAALKANRAEERYIEQQAFEQQRAERARTAGAGGNIGFKGTAVEIQAIDTLLGIHIPRGLTSVLARLGSVQSAMSAAFGAFAILAFVEVLGQVASKLISLEADINGFTEANEKFWKSASDNSIKALADLLKYNTEMRRAHELSEKRGSEGRKELGIEGIAKEREDIKRQLGQHRDVLNESIAMLQTIQPGQMEGDVPSSQISGMFQKLQGILNYITPESGVTGAVTAAGAIANLKDTIERETKIIGVYTDTLKDLQVEEKRDTDRRITESRESSKKMHDAIHEFPNRLPWFLGPNQDFVNQMGAGRVSSSNFRPAPPLGGIMPRRSSAGSFSPSIPTSSDGGSSGGVVLQVTSSPTFYFNGIPADIQNFMRNYAEPELLKDLQLNARGIQQQLIQTLKNGGVVTK